MGFSFFNLSNDFYTYTHACILRITLGGRVAGWGWEFRTSIFKLPGEVAIRGRSSRRKWVSWLLSGYLSIYRTHSTSTGWLHDFGPSVVIFSILSFHSQYPDPRHLLLAILFCFIHFHDHNVLERFLLFLVILAYSFLEGIDQVWVGLQLDWGSRMNKSRLAGRIWGVHALDIDVDPTFFSIAFSANLIISHKAALICIMLFMLHVLLP